MGRWSRDTHVSPGRWSRDTRVWGDGTANRSRDTRVWGDGAANRPLCKQLDIVHDLLVFLYGGFVRVVAQDPRNVHFAFLCQQSALNSLPSGARKTIRHMAYEETQQAKILLFLLHCLLH